MQILYSEGVEKIFPIKEFLETYPSVLSNYHKTKIKKYFIQLIQKLEDQRRILDRLEPKQRQVQQDHQNRGLVLAVAQVARIQLGIPLLFLTEERR